MLYAMIWRPLIFLFVEFDAHERGLDGRRKFGMESTQTDRHILYKYNPYLPSFIPDGSRSSSLLRSLRFAYIRPLAGSLRFAPRSICGAQFSLILIQPIPST